MGKSEKLERSSIVAFRVRACTALPVRRFSMSDATVGVNSSLNSVSGTLDLVANAARSGAADARVAASKALSNTSLFLSRVVYQTTYAVSYGVVFPAAFVARGIPRNNAA